MNTSSNVEVKRSALHDPVPEGTSTEVYGQTTICGKAEQYPHRVEKEVHHLLTQVPEVKFSSLSIHRMADGVCIDGVVHMSSGDASDLTRIALQVAGVNHVLNHLTACPDE